MTIASACAAPLLARYLVLIVPLLVSFGGIDRGLPGRLDGLTSTMPNAGFVPDDRVVAWVLLMAGGAR